jgi:hypothetical protein
MFSTLWFEQMLMLYFCIQELISFLRKKTKQKTFRETTHLFFLFYVLTVAVKFMEPLYYSSALFIK